MAKPKSPLKSTTTTIQKPKQKNQPPSWAIVRGIFSSKHQTQSQQQPPKDQTQSKKQNSTMSKENKTDKKCKKKQQQGIEETSKRSTKKMKCSGSICSNTKVMHRPEPSPKKKIKSDPVNESSSRSIKVPPLNELVNGVNDVNSTNCSSISSSSINGGSFRGMPFRRFSGCYECRMVVDPVLGIARDPSLRSSICSCPDCGEIFTKTENLELHQATRHAVSELGPEDTSKNIVEIIFQSSWLKKEIPVCKIDRILKVHNMQKTISKFEEYRDSIKTKANKLAKKHPRCIADGNELLRFHSTSFACSLGLNGSSNLCNTIPHCNVCSIIKNGFKMNNNAGGTVGGILTTATSGRAHDKADVADGNVERRAMLVCRVIAGRVKKSNVESNGGTEYDSIGGAIGVYSNLDELYVFNAKAILPCFVVIYRGV